jgi:hypothetical protein
MRLVPVLLTLAACARPAPATGRERLPAELRARADESSVPVLLPRTLDLSRASLIVESTYTALSVPAPGITVSLHTVRIAHEHPGVTAAGAPRPIRGGNGYVTVNEGIRVATWTEDGVAYSLDLECAQAGDPRCADDTYLLSLVEELAP